MRDLGTGVLPLGATHRRPRDWAGALQPGRQTYIAISRHISPYLPTSPSFLLCSQVARRISPYLPTSPHISLWHSQAARRISPYLAISRHLSPSLFTSPQISLCSQAARPVYGLNEVLQVARIGGFLSPLLLLAGDRSPHVPYAVWGALSLIAGVATLAARRAVFSFGEPHFFF